MFTSNICSPFINQGDKTVSKLYRKHLTNTRLLFIRALESRLCDIYIYIYIYMPTSSKIICY